MPPPHTILLTGCNGFIGSHACVELLNAGYSLVGIDNLCNSEAKVTERIRAIAGRELVFVRADLCDRQALEQVFKDHTPGAVMHFAGLKAVGESVAKPLTYYRNNLCGTINLLDCMAQAGVRRMIFSSSATVYSQDNPMPLSEDAALGPANPYGETKHCIENMLRALVVAEPEWRFGILRYFNPVGAHPSGLLGERPTGIPNNLMPYISQVAAGERARLRIFGNDYPTPDGTGIRDYIHVLDLARAHLHALQRIDSLTGAPAINLGTGRGSSVLEVVQAFARAANRELPWEVAPRRPGDAAVCYTATDKARELLDWSAEHDLDTMCRDAWRWQQSLQASG